MHPISCHIHIFYFSCSFSVRSIFFLYSCPPLAQRAYHWWPFPLGYATKKDNIKLLSAQLSLKIHMVSELNKLDQDEVTGYNCQCVVTQSTLRMNKTSYIQYYSCFFFVFVFWVLKHGIWYKLYFVYKQNLFFYSDNQLRCVPLLIVYRGNTDVTRNNTGSHACRPSWSRNTKTFLCVG